MMIFDDVKGLLDRTLHLEGGVEHMLLSTPLLGDIPELDSMAVVALITGLEEFYGFVIDDDEIDADVFETVGSMVAFVEGKI
jgi:acyl carrier protein